MKSHLDIVFICASVLEKDAGTIDMRIKDSTNLANFILHIEH